MYESFQFLSLCLPQLLAPAKTLPGYGHCHQFVHHCDYDVVTIGITIASISLVQLGTSLAPMHLNGKTPGHCYT